MNIDDHPLYSTWENMRQRCVNPRRKNYKDYGGRGITVCERWDNFSLFASDMGPKPSPAHCLDREDNDAGYSPENCRWATRKEQIANQRIRFDAILIGAERLPDFCRRTGVSYKALHHLIRENRCPATRIGKTATTQELRQSLKDLGPDAMTQQTMAVLSILSSSGGGR